MRRLNPDKLHISYPDNISPDILDLPRRYTLTHSDRTGHLFLSIGHDYNRKQISGIYTRLMRDEVLAECIDEQGKLLFKLYCHVSGGLIFGTAGFRYSILRHELPLVIECLRYGDRMLFDCNTKLDSAPVLVHFSSTSRKYNVVENWGHIADYR